MIGKFTSGSTVHGGAVVYPGNAVQNYFYDRPDAVHNPSGSNNLTIVGVGLVDRILPPSPLDNASGVAAPAVIYLPATQYRRHVLKTLLWGYDTPPSSGYIQVESPSGNVICGPIPVTSEGAGQLLWEQGLPGAISADMRVVLSNGGPSVIGRINVTRTYAG